MAVMYVIDQDNDIIGEIGVIDGMELREFTDFAYEQNLKVMPFIDFVGNSIFNEKQMYQLKKEMEILRALPQAQQYAHILDFIERGIEVALQSVHRYLKFLGD